MSFSCGWHARSVDTEAIRKRRRRQPTVRAPRSTRGGHRLWKIPISQTVKPSGITKHVANVCCVPIWQWTAPAYVCTYLLSVRSSIHWIPRSGSTAGYFWGTHGEPVFKGSIFWSVDLLTMDFAVMVTKDQWLKKLSFGPSIGWLWYFCDAHREPMVRTSIFWSFDWLTESEEEGKPKPRFDLLRPMDISVVLREKPVVKRSVFWSIDWLTGREERSKTRERESEARVCLTRKRFRSGTRRDFAAW